MVSGHLPRRHHGGLSSLLQLAGSVARKSSRRFVSEQLLRKLSSNNFSTGLSLGWVPRRGSPASSVELQHLTLLPSRWVSRDLRTGGILQDLASGEIYETSQIDEVMLLLILRVGLEIRRFRFSCSSFSWNAIRLCLGDTCRPEVDLDVPVPLGGVDSHCKNLRNFPCLLPFAV